MRDRQPKTDICEFVRRQHGDGHAYMARVTCCECPTHAEHRQGFQRRKYPGSAKGHIIEVFERDGWKHCGGARWLCPAHKQEAEKKRKGGQVIPLKKKERQTMGSTQKKGAAVVNVSPKDTRRIMAKIEETFEENENDDGSGLYVDGWSDERVAEVLDVPRAAVADHRERYFGELAEDRAITELRGLLDDLVKQVADVECRIDRLAADRKRAGFGR